MRIVIAIDGPSGSGKSTVARAVAARLGYLYVDSGAMYRAVALRAREESIPPDAIERLTALAERMQIDLKRDSAGVRIFVDARDVTDAIRTPEISKGASLIAVLPAVRERLVAQQQRIGASGGIVMEGRDIGTVVFPKAELKIFLDATPDERARRRHAQHLEQGIESSLERTKKEVEERDRRDSTRSVSPLVQAPDAVYLDSTALTAEEVVDVIVRLAEKQTQENNRMAGT
ncbi:MAG TPA: (d)CMP kinase [Candidatus Acidoferrales bacterium]|nr:(d)CMP kinase [Candidatus Acidoferrales bacterium]